MRLSLRASYTQNSLHDKRPALVIDAAQKFPEIRAGTQGGNDYRAILARSCGGGHILSISIL